MDGNRDEAMKAREVAEKMMKTNDFEGARKIALKAKKLFPELENLSQLLLVCDVHCSAKQKLFGTEKDWYGILQVEKLADELTIKKQYRKLALVLHPDKNKLPGAEAAFKLIGEANMVLSDQGKRSLYDNKCRFSVRTVATNPPPHQANWSFGVRKMAQPDLSGGQQTFWTSCPFCSIKYQYHRGFVNRALRCPNCSKPFIAYDLGSQGPAPVPNSGQPFGQRVNAGSTWGQPVFPQPKQVPKKAFKGGRTVGSEVGGGSNTKRKEAGHVNSEDVKVGASRNTSRKRGRKLVVESSESSDAVSSSDSEEVVVGKTGGNTGGKYNSGLDSAHCRRSSRQRQRVSYNENGSDGEDLMSPPKRSRESKSSTHCEEEKREDLGNEELEVGNSAGVPTDKDVGDEEIIKQKGSAGAEENGVDAKDEVIEEEKASTVDPDTKKSNVNGDSEPDPDFYPCLDPEFTDFDEDKEEKCFSIDQVWACYDSIDAMPRFYALVKKVYSPVFKLQITWLEPDPEDQGQIDWVKAGLPIPCGKFVPGSTEETVDRLIFSHQIPFEKGSQSSYVIYPRTGETWALFKDWDIKWSSDPANHKSYNFEIVEILSDFEDDSGIEVSYLKKVKGFVSLFKRKTHGGISSFLIPPSEKLRFSHQIPSCKMTGKERDGVPKGSFELDPASLPTDFDEFYKPNVVKVKTKSSEEKVVPENMNTPMKCVDLEGKNDNEKETFKVRRSPRELNSTDKKRTQEEPVKHSKGTKEKRNGEFTPSKGNASSRLADEKIVVLVDTSPESSSKSPTIPPSFSEVFFNFDEYRSVEKFQLGQIWAVFGNHGLPRNYGQIKKIETQSFGVKVALVESCKTPKEISPVCCGLFKVQTGRPKLYSQKSFSHLVKAQYIGNNRFEIYPREGEIWALYKNWNADVSRSHLADCEYEIVAILDCNEQRMKVSSLVQVTGFRSVFRAQRSQRSDAGIFEVPRGELARFSHQIPAFQLTEEKDGCLRDCWELDPSSIPGNLPSVC